jgi:hypothetical protein
MTPAEYAANITARFGKPLRGRSLFAWLADMENAASRTRPPMNTAMRKTVSEARVAAILEYVRCNPGVTVSGVAAAMGFGPDIARVGMVQLETQGLLERGERCNPGAEWRAVENNPLPAK